MSASERIGPGRLVLVVGPSGAGKDTLIEGAKAHFSGDPAVVFPRRIVTRPANGAEDHDSLDDAAFDRAAGGGAFAFWWRAHGLKYGIARGVEDDIRHGRTVVCNVSRAIIPDVRTRFARVDAVLITAPPEILSARLAARARGTDGSLAKRIERNSAFAGLRPDHVIENTGAAQDAVRKLVELIGGRTQPAR